MVIVLERTIYITEMAYIMMVSGKNKIRILALVMDKIFVRGPKIMRKVAI